MHSRRFSPARPRGYGRQGREAQRAQIYVPAAVASVRSSSVVFSPKATSIAPAAGAVRLALNDAKRNAASLERSGRRVQRSRSPQSRGTLRHPSMDCGSRPGTERELRPPAAVQGVPASSARHAKINSVLRTCSEPQVKTIAAYAPVRIGRPRTPHRAARAVHRASIGASAKKNTKALE